MRLYRSFLLLITLAIASAAWAQRKAAVTDWPNLGRYAAANAELMCEPDTQRVVLLGNSITENWVKFRPQFFNTTGYVGRGISGQTSQQLLLRFRDDVINLKPQVVVIAVGTNDIAQNTGPYSESRTMGNIKSMCELARVNGIKVILTSVLPCDRMYWSKATGVVAKIASLNACIKEYAQSQEYTYVDYFTPLATDKGALRPEFTTDGVHPNAAGYAVMEPLLTQAVSSVLK